MMVNPNRWKRYPIFPPPGLYRRSHKYIAAIPSDDGDSSLYCCYCLEKAPEQGALTILRSGAEKTRDSRKRSLPEKGPFLI